MLIFTWFNYIFQQLRKVMQAIMLVGGEVLPLVVVLPVGLLGADCK